MQPSYTVFAIFCAIALALGQVLFKAGALKMRDTTGIEFILSCFSNKFIITAIVIYTAVTFLWIWLLRSANLSQVFPMTALVYVIVPFAGVMIWKEPYNLSLLIGVVLIVSGVLMISLARV